MTFYAGAPLGRASVRIGPPSGTDLIELADRESWRGAGGPIATTKRAVKEWTDKARSRDDVLMFEISEDGRPVGQVFLHDIDRGRRESLIGYHILDDTDRGRGLATIAVDLLVGYARSETDLEELVIITAGDNVRSRRVAEKNGFALTGAPHEDPTALCFKLRLERA